MSLEEYEAEYRGHVDEATGKLDVALGAASYDERRAAASAADLAIQAAKDSLEMVELKGRALSGSAKSSLQSRLRSYRGDISDLKSRLKESRAAQMATSTDCIREDLFSTNSRDDSGERARMLATNERLMQGNERLKEAHSVTLEMESMAGSILNDLSKQRETMLRSKGTLAYAGQQLDASRRVLQAMARRAATNKLVLYLVVGLIGGLILLTAWSQTSNPSPGG